MSNYISEKYIVRTPAIKAYNLNNLFGCKDRHSLKQYVLNFFSTETNRIALYVSSMELFDLLLKIDNDRTHKDEEKIVTTLCKYIIRMASRSTPFGLFSGCSVGIFSKENKLDISGNQKVLRKIDHTIISFFINGLFSSTHLRPYFSYTANNTIYKVEDKLRYVEHKYSQFVSSYELSSFDATVILQEILLFAAKNAKFNISDLLIISVKYEIDVTEFTDYVNMLIDNGFFIPSFGYSAFEESALKEILSHIADVPDEVTFKLGDNIISVMQFKNTLASLLSFEGLFDCREIMLSDFVAIEELIQNICPNKSNITQLDLFKQSSEITTSPKFKEDILEVIDFLDFTQNIKIENLTKFTENFFTRYEDEEVDLLKALDPEIGIIDISSKNEAEAFAEIGIEYYTTEDPSIKKFERFDEYLLNRMFAKKDTEEIKLTKSNFKNIKGFKVNASLSIMFECVMSENKIKYVLKPSISTTGSVYISRFSQLDAQIKELISEVSATEEKFYGEEVIVAEINHLPLEKGNNLVIRPLTYKHEISCLGGTNSSGIIVDLNDLTLSVRNSKLIIKSKKYNKVVIPVFSSAFNTTLSHLPIFKFLSNYQDTYYLGYKWNRVFVNNVSFLPRISYNETIIISPAKWILFPKDVQNIFQNGSDANNELRKLISDKGIPNYIRLINGENHILINFSSFISVEIFLKEIKKMTRIILEEAFINTNELATIDDWWHGNEHIFFIHTDDRNNFKPAKKISNLEVQRQFILLDDWLYFKLYANEIILDKLLCGDIKLLMEQLVKDEIIAMWFFVRYYDPEPHLRIRLKLFQTENNMQVIKNINTVFQKHIANGSIIKIQYDTYKRELERYGHNNIEQSEILFSYDTALVTNGILIFKEKNIKERWLLGICLIDKYLSDFKLTNLAKEIFVANSFEMFNSEFPNKTSVNRQISMFYRKNKEKIYNFLSENFFGKYTNLNETNYQKTVNGVLLFGNNDSTLNNGLLGSYCHMSMNRLFMTAQRKNEMIIFGILHIHYKSLNARIK